MSRYNSGTVEACREELPRPIKLVKDSKEWVKFITGSMVDVCVRDEFRGILEGEDLEFVLSILPNHPNYENKIAPYNLKSIEVCQAYASIPGTNDKWNNITIHFHDGEDVVDFSLNKCAGKATKRTSVIAAMRGCVAFRHGQGTDGMHLDHGGDYPFIRIANMFLAQTPHSVEDLYDSIITINEAHRGYNKLDDADGFIDYHDKYADLNLITASENLAKAHEAKQYS